MKFSLDLFPSDYYGKIKNCGANSRLEINIIMIEAIKNTKTVGITCNVKTITRNQVCLISMLPRCIKYYDFFESIVSCSLQLLPVSK